MAIPVYESNGGIASSTGGTTVDVPFMGTINADDILVMHVIAGALDSWTTPTNWNLIGSQQYTGTASLTYAVFWKRATGSESGNETVTFGTTETLAGVMSRYSGCLASGSPIEDPAFLNGRSETEDANFYWDSMTTTDTDRLGVIFLGVSNDTTPTTEPSGWNIDHQLTSTTGTDSGLNGYSLDIATAQTISAGSAIIARFNSYATLIFALKPVVAGGPNLSGSTSLSLLATALIKAIGLMSGSASIDILMTGLIKAIGLIKSTVSFTITATGKLLGIGILKGAGSIILTATGNLTTAISGVLKGATSLTLDATAKLKATALMIGGASVNLLATGLIKARGLMSGVLSIILIATGRLLSGADSIELIEEDSLITLTIEENSTITQSITENSTITQATIKNSLI